MPNTMTLHEAFLSSPSFAVLAFINLCYAAFCAFIVLRRKPEPIQHPYQDHHSLASHDALCACILFATGCINVAVASVRVVQAGPDTMIMDYVTTSFFFLAACTNHVTAYVYLLRKLRGALREGACGCATQVWRDAEKRGSSAT
ncbi:hypothetical protein FPV67DRAFT_1503365 [Lyophyllum atratum]|nr:hypothetical protein FPV67DRAFT_1503365 [Lyophyllum atratum]